MTDNIIVSWSSLFLEDDDPRTASLARRLAIAVGLCALYGVAMGVCAGGPSILVHAAGVPAAVLAVLGLGVPALYIVLTIFGAPLVPARLAEATVGAFASTGIVLAGLAPAVALFVVTSGAPSTAAIASGTGLALGGAIGLRRFLRSLHEQLADADSATRAVSLIACAGFSLFAVALAARVSIGTLPLLGGGS